MPARRASSSSACATFFDFRSVAILVTGLIARRTRGCRAAWGIIAALGLTGALPAAADRSSWNELELRAAGQAVYFNAWGGDPAINRYIEWASGRVLERHGVPLVHVKVTDIAEAVSRIMAERIAGRDSDGSVDLLWINGENFAALKQAGLLWGPWTDRLPNSALVDWHGNPTTRIDFTLPTEGHELPWGTSAFTLFYDRSRIQETPTDPATLLSWIESNPGRFSYPQPPSFLGTAFLKQMLMALIDDADRLQKPAGADFPAITAPLWAWLDRAHAGMWRRGRIFPRSGPAQRELLASGELDWMMSYNPSEASRAIRQGELHATVGGLYLSGGVLANSHFLAIPYNAGAKEGAMLVANFLISPEAQARKSDTRIWGDPSVLDQDQLTAGDRALFQGATRDAATPDTADRLLPEPHPSWSTLLERAWLERYTR
jgi:putative thiamine transport system substrate-binding protein